MEIFLEVLRKTPALCPLADINNFHQPFPICRQMSHLLVSNCHRTTLQDIPHTNSDPLDSLNTKLQLVPCNNILTTISPSGSVGTKTESTQDCWLSQLQDKSTFSCRLSQLRVTEFPSLPLKWIKAKTNTEFLLKLQKKNLGKKI